MYLRDLVTAFFMLSIFVPGPEVLAQASSGEEAFRILEKFTGKVASEEGFSASFSFTSEDSQLKKSDTWEGKLWIHKEKYRVETTSLLLLCDGVKRWQFLPEVNEVNVQLCSRILPDEEEWMITNPVSFFTLYTKKYFAQRVGQTTLQQRRVEEIDLIPRSTKAEISRIKLWIDVQSFELVSTRIIQKSGVQYTLIFNNYRWKEVLPEKDYQFDPMLFPGVEIIEMDL
ncbi:MAG: outer membrane lipoprotein carrier protein LolA [Bacteroidales bacterium]|nr:outer membrane lipoprotein carrier protein LolA [Bacteroidales bacterium]